MKKLFILLMFILLADLIAAQESSIKSKLRFNDDYQTYKNFSLGLDFTYDIWQDMPEAIGHKGFNRSTGFFGTYNIRINKSNFYFCPGLGFNFRNIYSDALLQRDSVNGIAYVPIPDKINYDKAKTMLSYIELPVDIRYSYKRFQVGIGLKISCNIGVTHKYKGDKFTTDDIAGTLTGSKVKEKWLQIPDAERFQFGGQIRIGYSWIHAYGYYSFSKVFKSKTNIDMYPISVGISIMPFK